MSTSKLAYVFCLGLLFLCLFTQAECADWKIFYQVEDGPKYYFDKESVVKPQQGIVQVWLKLTLEKDSSDEAEQYRNHVEINCKSKSYKVLEESKADTVGNEEKTQQSSTGQLRSLPLESAMGSLWANLCPHR
jgi:hypothetical protein